MNHPSVCLFPGIFRCMRLLFLVVFSQQSLPCVAIESMLCRFGGLRTYVVPYMARVHDTSQSRPTHRASGEAQTTSRVKYLNGVVFLIHDGAKT